MSDWLKTRKKGSKKRADVVMIYSIPGGGKTSFAAQFRDPTFAMSASETGLLTLMSKGLVPDCDYFPEFTEWLHVMDSTEEMIVSGDRPRTFAVDTVNGIESLLVDHVCKTKYDGEMTKKGFLNFQEGWQALLPMWREWIAKLERLRNKGTVIVLLSHARVINFKNPHGPDYHRFVSELHEGTAAAMSKFADMVCFIDFNTEVANVDKAVNRGKGTGGRNRVYHFERDAAFEAKHRHGLPPFMLGKGNAKADFDEFSKLVNAGASPKPTADKKVGADWTPNYEEETESSKTESSEAEGN